MKFHKKNEILRCMLKLFFVLECGDKKEAMHES